MLIGAGISLDYLLHIAQLVWIGRYLGILGTLFLVLSFGYSARKNKVIKTGAMKVFLKFHCKAGWVGTLMIFIHSGIHFNALLPWAATGFMMVVTASGHVGQHLLKKVKEEVKAKMKLLGVDASLDAELEQQHYWDALTVKALEQWRSLHMPMVSVLLSLSLIHILSIFFFLELEVMNS